MNAVIFPNHFLPKAKRSVGNKQELRSWFEVNAKFPSTTPRLNITFSCHDPQNEKYKSRTADELGKGMAIYLLLKSVFSDHCVVQLSMYFISLHHARGS